VIVPLIVRDSVESVTCCATPRSSIAGRPMIGVTVAPSVTRVPR
jgi:hypothetical protein